MRPTRRILGLATCTALLTSCGSEYQPFTKAPEPTTPPLEALLVRAGPNSTGTGTVAGNGIDCAISGATLANTCATSLSRGNVVTLTAAATGGSTFLAWGDACVASGSSATCTVTLSEALAVSASFAAPPPPPPPPTYTVTIRRAASSTGTGTVSGSGISCSITASSQTGDCSETFVQGTQLSLTAAATGGSSFAGWSGACAAAGATATCTLTVSQNTSVDASFAPPPPPPPTYVVTVRAGTGATGSGTVSGSGINCAISGTSQSGDCSETLVQGAQLTLTAAAAGGGSFAGWGGACLSAGASATCAVTVNQATNVDASFAPPVTPPPPPPPPPPTYTVTIRAAAGSGGAGTVSGTGISCSITTSSQSGDCSETFPQGTQLSLTAAATGGGSFVGWSGACASAGTTATCTLTVSQNTSVDASFAPPPPPPPSRYVVTVAAGTSGTGTGTVTASGIACTISAASQSGDCTEEREQGTQFTLTATATGGSSFAGWSGGCSGTAATCTITVSQATTIRASFTAPPPPNLAGFWSGSDAGINVHYHITLAQSGATLSLPSCVTGDCRLTALTSTGSGWLGASYRDIASLTGTASTTSVTFTMNLGDRTVTFDGALTSPTQMVGQVSSPTMAPQSLTLGRQ
jgi:hypothetical protein